jgi:hypothetical protein
MRRDQSMDERTPMNSLLGRSFFGAFAGAVFGAVIETIFFWGPASGEGIRFPAMGTLIGASVVAAVAIIAGAREFPAWFARPAIGLLAGAILGILTGAFVFAPVMTMLTGPWGDFPGKAFAGFQFIGAPCGAALGAVVGLIVGIAKGFVRQSTANEHSDSPALGTAPTGRLDS